MMAKLARGGVCVAGLACLSVLGCSSVRPRLWSTPAEYAAYREVRIAREPLQVLRAERAYLARFPSGAFQAEVADRFEHDEQAFYDRRKPFKEGLEEYLTLLPDGPHAMEAGLRIADFKERSGETATERLVAKSKGMEERLRLASENRRAALEAVSEWVAELATVHQMGKIVDDAPVLSPSFDARFRARPKPKCDRERCLRLEAWPYQVPIAGGGLDELEITLQVTAKRVGDDVTAVSLHGPALFSRTWEASQGVPLPKDELGARAFAVGYVGELVAGTFASVLPASCDVPAAPPVVLKRACQGLELTVVAGESAADDDAITLVRAAR
jgi:hypothetical protein